MNFSITKNPIRKNHMNTKTRAVIVAALAVASIFAFSTTANAGSYHVQSCHSGSGYHVQQGWNLATNGTSGGSIQGCTSGYFRMQDTVGGGTNWLLLHTPILPSNLTFSATTFSYFAQGPNTAGRAQARYCATANVVGGLCNAGYWDYAAYTATGQGSPSNKTVGCALTGANLCKELQFYLDLSGSTGHFWFGNLDFTVNDPTSPTTSTPAGGTLLSSQNTAGRAWNRGTKTFNIGGSDGGAGMKSINSYVDTASNGATITAPTACAGGPYVEFQPCPGSHNSSASINTAAYSSGQHTLYATATDASDNVGSSSVTFYADNEKPTTPIDIEPVVSGQDGWSSTNSFGADWTNGAEVAETSTVSGIASVIVDVNPTDTDTQSDPAAVTVPVGGSNGGIAATASSISGLTVPAKGLWKLRLQLVDKAGNISDVGSGTGSDSDIGFDPDTPPKPGGQSNGWINRADLASGIVQQWFITIPQGGSPICGYAHSITSGTTASDPGSTITLPGAPTFFAIPSNLAEGFHKLNLKSVNCAGNAAATFESFDENVDVTDPNGTIAGVQGGRWYKNGQSVQLSATDALSGMTASTSGDPEDGGYLRYTLDGGTPVLLAGGSGTIAVTGEGQRTLEFAPVDVAGNQAAPKRVTFGIDGGAPTTPGFNAQDPNRPTRLSIPVADAVSGLDNATIEVRNQGGGDWVTLNTGVNDAAGNAIGGYPHSAILNARFPDTELPKGTYLVRVRGYDQAGNELVTSKLASGGDFIVENPMRAATGASVKLFKALRECKKGKNGKMKCVIKKCTKKSKGTCYKVRKGKVVLQGGSATVTSEYNRGAIATGVLTDESGKALKNTDVTVSTVDKFKRPGENSNLTREVGTATTDANGIFAVRVPAGVNKTVKVSYDGSETRRSSLATATSLTKAKLKLKVSKSKVRTGQTVTFSGKVTSWDASYPTGGKIVALQFFAGKKWRPAVGVGHTDSKGNFKIKYKFDGARVKAKIIFRVAAPSEDAWGHVYSVSKPKIIRLNH